MGLDTKSSLGIRTYCAFVVFGGISWYTAFMGFFMETLFLSRFWGEKL